MEIAQKAVGSFEVKSGKVYVSDPCYTPGTWCHGVLENVKNGKWTALVEQKDEGSEWGVRNVGLIAHHEMYDISKMKQEVVELCSFVVGVDSGQAGIFDFDTYRNDEVAKPYVKMTRYEGNEDKLEQGEIWYDMCCSRTMYPKGSGIVPGGVVAQSGYGDGTYTAWCARNGDKEIVAMGIVFITDGDDEEWEDGDI